MAAAASPLKIGRYVLHREIASGGMASVHFGTLVATGGFRKTVAIKRLHPAFARHVTLKESILEEARLASRIRHPNVVPPLDVVSEKGELLLVMEYVHGESLSKLMRASRNLAEPIPVEIGASIMTNVLHGLHAAHEAKDERGVPLDIVHRDVSPQNVLVGIDGVARVIDFGIAKAVTSSENTTAGTIKGKVPYLAPEQLEGEPATRLTDIYAASVVFWEVLAGKRLFDASEDPEVLRQILQMEVPPPSAYNRAVPPEIDQIILCGIARQPGARYATARDMALDIERSIHLATPTQVGAWAERLAKDSIAMRGAMLAEVETAPRPKSSRPPPPDMVLNETILAPAAQIVPKAPSVPKLEVEPLKPPPAGALRKPEIEIPNVAWLPHPTMTVDPPTQIPGWLRFFGVIGVVVALLAAVIWILLPSMVRKRVVGDAALVGVDLTVGDVEVTRQGFRLLGVKAKSAEVPEIEADVDAVTLQVSSFTPVGIKLEGLTVRANGTHAAVLSRIERFRAGKGKGFEDLAFGYRAVEIASAKLDWKDPFGPGSSAVAENIQIERTADEAHLLMPLFHLRAGASTAGPWSLVLDSNPMFTRAVLKLDPTQTYATTVTFTFAADGGVEAAFSVPPTALGDLHVPQSLFGGAPTNKTRLGITGTVNLVTVEGSPRRGVGGRIFVTGSALALVPNGPPLDALLDLELKGEEDAPIAVPAAQLVLTPYDLTATKPVPVATSKLAGTVEIGQGHTAIELAGKTTSMPCTPRGDVALRVQLSAALDRLADAKVLFEPTASCVPRIK